MITYEYSKGKSKNKFEAPVIVKIDSKISGVIKSVGNGYKYISIINKIKREVFPTLIQCQRNLSNNIIE